MVNVNFTPFPVIHTNRFVLRPLRPGDDKELFILRTDPVVNEFIDRKTPSTVEEVREFIALIMDNIQKNEAILWAVCAKGEEDLSGTICLWKINVAEEKAEIGYELLSHHHGHGIMQEVIPAVLKFGFEKLGLKSIEAELHRDNIKSLKLLERNGFLRDATAISDHPDMIIYKLNSVAR